jgi:hypothetical protein
MRTPMGGDDRLSTYGQPCSPAGEYRHVMTGANRSDIEHFVRGTLGCGCPDEVFQSIVIGRLPPAAGRPPMVQLLVGSRLLIHVVAMPEDAATGEWLEQLAAHGQAVRDRHGYNRFRLVLALPPSAAPPRGAAERFVSAVTGDARAHLHLLGADQLPDALQIPESRA